MKKIVAASVSALAFLALAACTEGDPGAMDQPMDQTPPAAAPADQPPPAPAVD